MPDSSAISAFEFTSDYFYLVRDSPINQINQISERKQLSTTAANR